MNEWESAAQELDKLEGNDEWKMDNSSDEYRPEVIEARLRELDEARTNCDIRGMMYLVRTSLSRDLGGMGNIDLYRHSYVGTKRLIERYVDSAIKTVEMLVEKSAFALPIDMDQRDLLDAVLHTRQSFGRSALLLSGGATFGMAHIGVLKAMFDANLLPRIISGASAGSIVCAVVCSRTDEEIPVVLHEFPYGDLDVFEQQGNEDGIADHIRRLLTEGSWSDIKHLTRVMRGILGDITFQEAYNRTRRICNIPVSTASIYELPRLLNYVTAPNVMLWSAVAASCSVPLVFNAAPLLVKDPITGEHLPWNPTPQRWIDGSVDNDLPMTRLAEMFNVNHFIVSQVNPHVVPFLVKDDPTPKNAVGGGTLQPPPNNSRWLQTVTTLARDEALHRLHFLAELGIFPNLFTKLRSVLSQKYSGDITILPEINPNDLPRILKNPTADFMIRSCLTGERATWPRLSRIRDRCAIELALDRAIHALRARVVFSKSQVNLRRLITEPMSMAGTGGGINRMDPSMSTPVLTDDENTADDTPRAYRHRRGSAGNIQLMGRHRKMLQDLEHCITDDDTEEEERLELSLRRGIPGGLHLGNNRVGNTTTSNASKPRLKRAAKSHFHLPMHHTTGPLTSPLPGQGAARVAFGFGQDLSFDFSKPLTPPNDGETHNSGNLTVPRKEPHRLANSTPLASDDTPSELDRSTASEAEDMDSSRTDESVLSGSDYREDAQTAAPTWPGHIDRHSQPEQPPKVDDMFAQARLERSIAPSGTTTELTGMWD
jgi:TAG lipase/steryl ester hydrolase/phospholipase A2/LPA acyltransferase